MSDTYSQECKTCGTRAGLRELHGWLRHGLVTVCSLDCMRRCPDIESRRQAWVGGITPHGWNFGDTGPLHSGRQLRCGGTGTCPECIAYADEAKRVGSGT